MLSRKAHCSRPMRTFVKDASTDMTRFGVAVGFVLVLIYLSRSAFQGQTPVLRQIMEILLDGVLVSSAGRLLIECMRRNTKERNVFSELRMAIVLGGVAMLYVAIGSLMRIII